MQFPKMRRSALIAWTILFSLTAGPRASAQNLCSEVFHHQEAHAPSGAVGLVPENVVRPQDVAAFLNWVKIYIPDLYKNTKDFPVNFWSAVAEQNHLQELFGKFEQYRSYVAHKTELLTFRIQTKKAATYRVDDFIKNASDLAHHSSSLEDLQSQLNQLQQIRGKGSSRGILNDLASLVPREDKEALRSNMSIESVLVYMQSHGGIPEKFRGTDYGLVAPWQASQVQARYQQLRDLEAHSEALRGALYFKQHETAFRSGQGQDLLENASGEIKNALATYKIKTDTSASSEKPVDLVLREVPDALAMMKSCVGVECTPPRFAFLPGERAFFIYDAGKMNAPKGYLAAAIVKNAAGEDVFYLKQFQGPRLSPEDVDAVLLKAQELALAMGYHHIAISGSPHSNYWAVFGANWQAFVDSNSPTTISFPDAELRDFIERENNSSNLPHHSEAVAYNSKAFHYKNHNPAKAATLTTSHETQKIQQQPLPPPSPLDRLEAGIAYARFTDDRTPMSEIANVFYQLGLKRESVTAITNIIRNPGAYTTSQAEEILIHHAQISGAASHRQETLDRLGYILEANRMRFSDSFAPENEEKNVTALVQKVRMLRLQNDHIFNNFVNLEGRQIPLLKQKILSLFLNAKAPDDLKVVARLITFLKPEHLVGDYSLHLVQAVDEAINRLNQGLQDQPASINSNLQKSDFAKMINFLYRSQKQAVLELIPRHEFKWPLSYYSPFDPEIRDTFRNFRTSAIWNLQQVSQDSNSRWWIVGDARTKEKELAFVIFHNQQPEIFATFTEKAKTQISKKLKDVCTTPGSSPICQGFLQKLQQARAQGADENHPEVHRLAMETLWQINAGK